jgi:hypothetical protein
MCIQEFPLKKKMDKSKRSPPIDMDIDQKEKAIPSDSFQTGTTTEAQKPISKSQKWRMKQKKKKEGLQLEGKKALGEITEHKNPEQKSELSDQQKTKKSYKIRKKTLRILRMERKTANKN